MIEVSLYSTPSADPNAAVGKCIARSRFNKEGIGVSVMEFVKGFLRDNLNSFETSLGNADLVGLINSGDDVVLSTKDFACINYYMSLAGFKVIIQNVAEDEENPYGVPSGEVIEWNVIDKNFVQWDYPTATKIIPAEGIEIPSLLRQIVQQSGLFNEQKFAGVKNPFTDLLNQLDAIKNTNGSVSPAITTQIYNLLDQMGINIFCATSED